MSKTQAFPNDTFISQQDYFDFIDRYPGYYGKSAYDLKKKLEKEVIPMPTIKPHIHNTPEEADRCKSGHGAFNPLRGVK